MNTKVFITMALTVVAVVVLSLFSFGPLSSLRKVAHTNPASLKPIGTQTIPVATSTGSVFRTYENRDRSVENYYAVAFPASWNVAPTAIPGGYVLTFPEGEGTVALMDVPDTSTLELFVLSQEEPKLKQSLQNYQRLNYQKTTVNGSEGYALSYTHSLSGALVHTTRTYVLGKDMSNVLTFTARDADFARMQPIFAAILQKFQWLTK